MTKGPLLCTHNHDGPHKTESSRRLKPNYALNYNARRRLWVSLDRIPPDTTQPTMKSIGPVQMGEHDESFSPTTSQTHRRRSAASEWHTSTAMQGQVNARPLKKLRGRLGALKGLPEMPLDILYEVFAFLGPCDLLHMARTTKLFRSTLLNRSARWIWKCTLANLDGFPGCPSDLTEPQYTSLAFDSCCRFCWKNDKNQTSILVWTDRKRSCKACFRENCNIKDLGLVYLPLHHINILPSILNYKVPPLGTYYSLCASSAYDTEYAQLNDENSRQEWIKRKTEEDESRKQHAKQYGVWLNEQNAKRSRERHEVRKRRYDAIKDKLVELGWGEEIEQLYRAPGWQWRKSLGHHKLVRQPKELTERTWNNIKGNLIKFLEERRAERFNMQRRSIIEMRRTTLSSIFTNYKNSQCPGAIIPNIADIVEMERFKAIIEDIPLHEDVVKHFEEAMKEFPSLVEAWRQTKMEELTQIMKPECKDATESTLHLATTFFRCTICDSTIGYPQIMEHSCLTRLSSGRNNDTRRTPWNWKCVSFHRSAHRAAGSILQACGLDPNTVTVDQLYYLTTVECLTCANLGLDLFKMKWCQAVHHVYSHRSIKVILTGPDDFDLQGCIGAIVVPNESPEADLYTYFDHSEQEYLCVRCHGTGSHDGIRGHVQSLHGIFEPRENYDYILRVWLRICYNHDAGAWEREGHVLV